MGDHSITVWLGFSGLVAALLVLDLGVLNRRSHVLTLREALSWSGGLVALALLFGLFVLWQESTPPRAGVLHRVPDRAVAQRRQSLRLPPHLLLLRRPRAMRSPRS